MQSTPTPQITINHTFPETGLQPYISRLLSHCGYSQPTPIQYHSIKTGIDRPQSSLICRSKSGTGKTIAYLGLMLHGLVRGNQVQGRTYWVVMVPTRELAVQIYQTLKAVLDGIHGVKAVTEEDKQAKHVLQTVTPMLTIGGLSFEDDRKKYRESPAQILITTVGRLWQLFRNNIPILGKNLTLIFDEGDKLFNTIDDKFSKVLKFVERGRWIVFSATYEARTMKALLGLKKWVYVQTGVNRGRMEVVVRDGEEMGEIEKGDEAEGKEEKEKEEKVEDDMNLENIKKYQMKLPSNSNFSHLDQKLFALSQILTDLHYQKCLIFIQKKSFLQQISQHLSSQSHDHILIHGSLTQAARFRMMNRINSTKIILASDLLARGIDIKLDLVVLFDFRQCDTFWHRVGRTGRYGRTGVVVSLEQVEEQEQEGKGSGVWANYDVKEINSILQQIQQFQKKQWYGSHMTQIGKWQDFDTNKQEQNNYKYYNEQKTAKQITQIESKIKSDLQHPSSMPKSVPSSRIGEALGKIKSKKELQDFIRDHVMGCGRCVELMEGTTRLTGYQFQIIKYLQM